MKRKIRFLPYFYAILFLFFVTSCQRKDKPKELGEKLPIVQKELDDTISGNIVYTKYKLPLPVELYNFMKEEKMRFRKEFINKTENSRKYLTSVALSVNFGIYASDLAYCIVFEQNQEAVNYFNLTKEIADKLHIAQGYDQAIIERMHSNLYNKDSLNQIASTSYWNACNFLEANSEINILPFIVAGGWVESIHLAIQTAEKGKMNPRIVNEIADQGESLKSLIKYLFDVMMDSNTFEVNQDIQDLGSKLNDLKVLYDDLKNNTKEKISQSQFEKISKKIGDIRAFYTK